MSFVNERILLQIFEDFIWRKPNENDLMWKKKWNETGEKESENRKF